MSLARRSETTWSVEHGTLQLYAYLLGYGVRFDFHGVSTVAMLLAERVLLLALSIQSLKSCGPTVGRGQNARGTIPTNSSRYIGYTHLGPSIATIRLPSWRNDHYRRIWT